MDNFSDIVHKRNNNKILDNLLSEIEKQFCEEKDEFVCAVIPIIVKNNTVQMKVLMLEELSKSMELEKLFDVFNEVLTYHVNYISEKSLKESKN